MEVVLCGISWGLEQQQKEEATVEKKGKESQQARTTTTPPPHLLFPLHQSTDMEVVLVDSQG
jgi:hypothetical protein